MRKDQICPDPPSRDPPAIRMDRLSEPTPPTHRGVGPDMRASDGVGLTEPGPPPSAPAGYHIDMGRLTEPTSSRSLAPDIADGRSTAIRLGDGMDTWKRPEHGIVKDQTSNTIGLEDQAKMLGRWVLDNHARNAKAFPEQLSSLWRQGREDFLHVLLHAFPDSMPLTREAGSPGEPTPQLITEGLTGRPVDLHLDR
jgi:hypothetical protein